MNFKTAYVHFMYDLESGPGVVARGLGDRAQDVGSNPSKRGRIYLTCHHCMVSWPLSATTGVKNFSGCWKCSLGKILQFHQIRDLRRMIFHGRSSSLSQIARYPRRWRVHLAHLTSVIDDVGYRRSKTCTRALTADSIVNCHSERWTIKNFKATVSIS